MLPCSLRCSRRRRRRMSVGVWGRRNVRRGSSTPSRKADLASRLPLADRRPCFLLIRAATLGLALVPMLFALGQRQFAFHSAGLEIHAGGNQREALLLEFPREFANLFFFNQQF